MDVCLLVSNVEEPLLGLLGEEVDHRVATDPNLEK